MRIFPGLPAGYESPNHPGTHEVFVAKKQDIIHVEKGLEDVILNELKIPGVKARIHSNYVIGGISSQQFQRALPAFLAEMPVDEVRTAEQFDRESSGKTILRIEANPGQYSQKVDYLNQCFALQEIGDANAKFYNTVVLERDGQPLSQTEEEKIKKYLVNIVEERAINKEERYKQPKAMRSPEWYDIVGGFRTLSSDGLTDMVKAKEIPLEIEDLLVIQKYFKHKRRDPSVLELLVLATYWSDHCRHTTFQTELGKIEITASPELKKDVEKTLRMFQNAKQDIGKKDTADTFMNIVTTPPKRLKQMGVENMKKVVISDEINAFTYETEIELEGGKKEKYLVMFKNETHNSPTQSAPFGGAATCFGGAVRDNLSGRGFTFYAMRVSGSADPTEPLDAKTMGALSQRFISQWSALGHASYANQMGTAAGVVEEYFSPGYRAKHFECGYVIAYAPKDAVKQEKPKKGDKIIQFGGYVGRDGYGGATVSSAGAGTASEKAVGSHVQNGNPVVQSAIQSLMLDTEFTRLIKRSNDFGAGGISVACGEIAPGVDIWLNKQKKKYAGLTPEELAICESQERMAIVISPENWKKAQKNCQKIQPGINRSRYRHEQ